MSSEDLEKRRKYDRDWKKKKRASMTLEERQQISARYKDYRKRWYHEHKEEYTAQVMEYRKRNPEKVKAWGKKENLRQKANGYKAQKEHHKRRLAQYHQIKSGLSCSRCGETHSAALDFHHKDPNEKEFDIGSHGRYRKRETLYAEIAKCVVICHNCHRKLHYEERGTQSRKYEQYKTTFDYQDGKAAWFQALKSKYSCQDCGEKHPACLDFHHIDPKTKKFSIGQKYRSYGKKRILNEIKKCVVHCANCHRKSHWEEKYGDETTERPMAA